MFTSHLQQWLASPRLKNACAAAVPVLLSAWLIWRLRLVLTPGNLLGWDSLGHLAKVAYWRDHLWPVGAWDGWFPLWHGGFQLFQFYPPGYYLIAGLLSLLPGATLDGTFNAMTLLAYALLPVSLFIASRWFGMGRSGAVACAGLSIFLDSAYGGGVSGQFVTGLLPFGGGLLIVLPILAGWRWALDHPTLLRSTVVAMMTACLFLTHTFSAYFAGVGVTVFLLGHIARRQWKGALIGLGIAVGAVILSGAWLIPALVKYPLHGKVGEWAVVSSGEMARDLISGRMFGSTVAAWLGVAGLIIGLRRGGWRREVAVLNLVMLGLAFGLVNRFLPFGQVVGSSQMVRFHPCLGLIQILMSGIAVEELWGRLSRFENLKRAGLALVFITLVMALGLADWRRFSNQMDHHILHTSWVNPIAEVKNMMAVIRRETPKEARLLAEFHWNSYPVYGTPHILGQALTLWAERADLGGNFPEASKVSINTLPLNQCFAAPPVDFSQRLKRHGVSHVVTMTAGAQDCLQRHPDFRRVHSIGALSLWALKDPGYLLSGPPEVQVTSTHIQTNQFTFMVDNRSSSAPVTVAVNAYPNWQVTWNDQPLTWTETADHFMQVDLPSGSGRLVWQFRRFGWERACDGVSLFAWLVAVGILCVRKKGGEFSGPP